MTDYFLKDAKDRRWLKEEIVPSVGPAYRIDKVHFEDMSEHQHLTVFENEQYGRVLALNGIIQVTTADEFIYHEMMTHVPLFAHGEVQRVLVIGGGDGGIIREVLRHPSVEQVTMVEIEREVVEFSEKWLPDISSGAFKSDRLDLVIEDGARFVKDTEDTFDVIIIDSTDPVGPGAVLFTEEFYRDCYACLNPGGIMVTQCGVPFLQPEELRNAYDRQQSHFEHVAFYVLATPCYYGGFMTLGFATDNVAALQCPPELIARRVEGAGLDFNYYAPDVHQAAFALPVYIRDILSA
mgnify:CR=1 FL=1